ncbi:unnamed protein product, partial [Rotaria sp. Silwood2]
HHGEIYRSRKYWYGNNEPKDVTRVEVVHVWPGEDNSRVASDVTPRKILEGIHNVGSSNENVEGHSRRSNSTTILGCE